MRRHNVFAICLSILSYRGFAQGITVYDNVNYKGQSAVITESTSLLGNDWNDRISSIKIPKGYRIQVFENPNYTGASIVLSGNWTVTNASAGWKNKISAIKIIEDPGQPVASASASASLSTRAHQPAPRIKAAVASTTPAGQIVTIESGDIRKIDENATQHGLPAATYSHTGYAPAENRGASPEAAGANSVTDNTVESTSNKAIATKQFNFKDALSRQGGNTPQTAISPAIAAQLPTSNPPAPANVSAQMPVDVKFVETTPIENRNKQYEPTHPLATNQPAPIKKYENSLAVSQPGRTMATGQPVHMPLAANGQSNVVNKASGIVPVSAPKGESTAATPANPPVSSVSAAKPAHMRHAANSQGVTVNKPATAISARTEIPVTKSNDAPAFAAGKITDKKQVDSHAVSYGRLPHAAPVSATEAKSDAGGKITVVRLPRQGADLAQPVAVQKTTGNLHTPNGQATHQLLAAKPEKDDIFEKKNNNINSVVTADGKSTAAPVDPRIVALQREDAQYDKKQFGNQRILTKKYVRHTVPAHSSGVVHLTLAATAPKIVEHKPAEVRKYDSVHTANKPVIGTGQKVAAKKIATPHAHTATKKDANDITRLALKDTKSESGGVRLTKEQMSSRILPFKINDVAIDGNNVSKVIYVTDAGDHGSFEYLGNGYWTESGVEISENYVEEKRDKWSVYLKDSRDMTVQIDLYQKKIFSDRFSNRSTDPSYTIIAARYAAK